MHICKTTRSLSTVAVGPRLLLQAEPAHLACKSVPLRRLLRACTSSVPLVPVDNVVAGFMGVFHSGDVGQTQASAEECEKSGYAPAGQSNPVSGSAARCACATVQRLQSGGAFISPPRSVSSACSCDFLDGGM